MSLHFQTDGFRLVYLAIAVLMWAVSGIFSREYMSHYPKRGRYYVFFWATFLATAGVFLSADLYTTFIFFEIMSFTSYVWVAFDERPESLRAAETYLAVAVLGGLVMLMGLFLLYDLCGTLEIDRLEEAVGTLVRSASSPEAAKRLQFRLYVAGGLLLFGFGAKAGCFPLHIWLPKAHPVAPAPASALLSGILTKAGVFGVIVVSCRMFGADGNWGLLVTGLGLVTMFLGALLAVFSVNLKRTLACSSVSQIGFILTGIGMSCLLRAAGEEPSLAVRGAFLHMVNHSLFKLVLFLCAGAVFMNLHQLELDEIRGFGRKKPVLQACFLMGALGLGGVPLFSGYVSKTLLHESIVEYQAAGQILGGAGLWKAAEWVFLVSGGMTVAYMLKLYVALFVDRHPTRQQEFDAIGGSGMNLSSAAALSLAAAAPPVLGLAAHPLMDRLADLGQGFFGWRGEAHRIAYFSLENLKGSLISLVIGVLIYVLLIRRFLMAPAGAEGERRYLDRWPAWLDLEDLLYRPVLGTLLPGVCGAVCAFLDHYLVTAAVAVFLFLSAVACRILDTLGDGVILAVRKTTHCQVRFREDEEGRRRVLELEPGERSLQERILANIRLVEASFSFGLMLFAIGLCVTLVYLLLVFFRE